MDDAGGRCRTLGAGRFFFLPKRANPCPLPPSKKDKRQRRSKSPRLEAQGRGPGGTERSGRTGQPWPVSAQKRGHSKPLVGTCLRGADPQIAPRWWHRFDDLGGFNRTTPAGGALGRIRGPRISHTRTRSLFALPPRQGAQRTVTSMCDLSDHSSRTRISPSSKSSRDDNKLQLLRSAVMAILPFDAVVPKAGDPQLLFCCPVLGWVKQLDRGDLTSCPPVSQTLPRETRLI